MLGELLGLGLRKRRLQGGGDARVQALAHRAQQPLIGDALHQRVLEAERRARPGRLLDQQAGGRELVEQDAQLERAAVGDGREQGMGEAAADHRANLRHLAGRAQPVEPAGQRGLQRGRDLMRPVLRQSLRRHRRTGFDNGLGQLLDEQRHAVGPLEDLLDQFGRQAKLAAEPFDELGAGGAAEPVQGQGVDVRPADPRRIEVGPERHQEQDCQPRYLADHAIEQLEAGRIAPVHVLEDRHDRPAARRRLDQPPQRIQRPLPALRRRQIELRIESLDVGQREKIGDQRGVVGRRPAVSQQGLQLVELRRG